MARFGIGRLARDDRHPQPRRSSIRLDMHSCAEAALIAVGHKRSISNQVLLPVHHAPLGAFIRLPPRAILQLMNAAPRTHLAVLGRLSDLRRQPIAYNLAWLHRFVADLAPDLLCAEITRKAWEGDDLSKAAVEVREALAPLSLPPTSSSFPLRPHHSSLPTSPRRRAGGATWCKHLTICCSGHNEKQIGQKKSTGRCLPPSATPSAR